MNRRRLVKGGAALAALAALGGGLEVHRRRDHALLSERITAPWPELGQGVHWLLPDLDRARMVVPDRPHSRKEAVVGNFGRSREFFVTSNSERLRGGPLEPKRGLRVLAIGDSVTFGYGVSEGQAYPAQLQELLRARGHSVQVLNAGVPAQSIFGMMGFIAHRAEALQVDAVLWTRRPQLDAQKPIPDYTRELNKARRALPGARFLVVLTPVSRFDPYGADHYAQEEQELRRVLEVPVLELTPVLWEAQRGGASCHPEGGDLVLTDGGRERLRAPRPERELPPAFYAAFEDDQDLKEHLFFDSGHPDAEGLTHFARAVADAVEAEGWLA